jgi:REP element-mobilizing transposase RayT
MIPAHHIIMTAYGFWLPNDPRGSGSDYVRQWELYHAGGKATRIETRTSVARREHDQTVRMSTKQALIRPSVEWDGHAALSIARGFEDVAKHWELQFLACSILPTHVHLVVNRTERRRPILLNQLKGRATAALLADARHPFQNESDPRGNRPSCWSRGGWLVHLDSVVAVNRAIKYVEESPIKDGKRAQRWRFVTAYAG